jgi:hypothetical protein
MAQASSLAGEFEQLAQTDPALAAALEDFLRSTGEEEKYAFEDLVDTYAAPAPDTDRTNLVTFIQKIKPHTEPPKAQELDKLILAVNRPLPEPRIYGEASLAVLQEMAERLLKEERDREAKLKLELETAIANAASTAVTESVKKAVTESVKKIKEALDSASANNDNWKSALEAFSAGLKGPDHV